MDEKTERRRAKAYEIWEREGRPHGRHSEHWDQAENELTEQNRPAAAPAAHEPAPKKEAKPRTAAPKAPARKKAAAAPAEKRPSAKTDRKDAPSTG